MAVVAEEESSISWVFGVRIHRYRPIPAKVDATDSRPRHKDVDIMVNGHVWPKDYNYASAEACVRQVLDEMFNGTYTITHMEIKHG